MTARSENVFQVLESNDNRSEVTLIIRRYSGLKQDRIVSNFNLISESEDIKDAAHFLTQKVRDHSSSKKLQNIFVTTELLFWNNGEFHCPCGTSLGKNLNGDIPFVLAKLHQEACSSYKNLVYGEQN